MQDEVLDLMTKGSVWTRNEGKKEGEQVKILWVTNLSLSEKAKVKHPPQVVYTSLEGLVYNRDLESFTAQYSFYNIDPELESKLESLLVFNEDDYDSEEDDSEDTEDQEDTEDVDVTQEVEVEAAVNKPKSLADMLSEEDDAESSTEILANALDIHEHPEELLFNHTDITFIMSAGERTAIPSDTLNDALIAYSQEPSKDLTMVLHKLLFRLSDQVTPASLAEAFMPVDEQNSGVDAFAVSGPYYQQVVAWTDFVGVFPEVAQGIAYASVLVGEGEVSDNEDSDSQGSFEGYVGPTEPVEEDGTEVTDVEARDVPGEFSIKNIVDEGSPIPGGVELQQQVQNVVESAQPVKIQVQSFVQNQNPQQ